MKEILCDPQHLLIIIGILLLAMVLLGSGKGLGTLISPLIKKLTGKSDVVINVENDDNPTERRRHPHLTIDDLRTVIAELNQGQKNCLVHEGVSRDIGFVIDECKSIWLEIKEVNKRQIALREKLPEQYVAKADMANIQERLRSIDGKLDRYMELAVKNAR